MRVLSIPVCLEHRGYVPEPWRHNQSLNRRGMRYLVMSLIIMNMMDMISMMTTMVLYICPQSVIYANRTFEFLFGIMNHFSQNIAASDNAVQSYFNEGYYGDYDYDDYDYEQYDGILSNLSKSHIVCLHCLSVHSLHCLHNICVHLK